MIDVKQVIQEIVDYKIQQNITPAHATTSEIRKKLYEKANKDLIKLIKNKEIDYGPTTNEHYFKPNG